MDGDTMVLLIYLVLFAVFGAAALWRKHGHRLRSWFRPHNPTRHAADTQAALDRLNARLRGVADAMDQARQDEYERAEDAAVEERARTIYEKAAPPPGRRE